MKFLFFNLLIIFCVAILISAQKIPAAKNLLVQYEKSIDEGKLAETERELFNYVIANPNDAKGFSLLAKLRLKQNRLNEAKSLSQKTLILDPKLASAKLILAVVNFQLGEIEQSRSILNGISETEIFNNAIRLTLAQNFALIGDCPKALTTSDKLPLKIRNNDVLPLRAACYWQTADKKNFAALIPIAKAAAKLNPLIALRFAEFLSKSGLHKETIDLLRLVIVTAPENTDTLVLLAKTEIYLKDFSNAKIHLAKAEKIQPESAELLFVKSFLENEQGNNMQAIDLLEKSLTKNPNNTEVLASFVITAMRANYAGKAVRAAEKLLNLQPDNPDFVYLFGASSLQNNNLKAAETSLTRFLEMRPNDSRGCVALGLTFAAQPDKFEAARGQMQKCLAINPTNFEAAYQLGLSYKTQGDNAKAVEYLEETVRLSPDYAVALRDLGAVYLLSSQEAKARPVLEKAALLNPNDADTHFQLSRLYNLISETALAKKHLKIFQKLRNPKKEGM